MSNDITKVFLSTVRALRTSAPSPSPTTSASQSVDLEKPRAVEDDFSSRSHALLRELAVVKKHIGTAGTLSIALASTNDPAAQKTYHDLATLISDTLEQCGELLRQLKCISTFDGKKNQRTEEPVKLQLSAHRKSVCRSLDEFLKSLRRSRDEQVSTYCRRLELSSRAQAPSVSVGGKSSWGTDSSWLFRDSSSRRDLSSEALPADSLTSEEFQQLEMENFEIYYRFLSEKNEITQLGSQISEIGRLQAMVTENLVEQAEKAERIGESVVGSTELVREANEQLRQSMDRTRGVRFWLIFILLTLTFSMHFLDWYG